MGGWTATGGVVHSDDRVMVLGDESPAALFTTGDVPPPVGEA